jgi:hypothetical protein
MVVTCINTLNKINKFHNIMVYVFKLYKYYFKEKKILNIYIYNK